MACSRRMFLLGTATTFAGAVLAACGSEPTEIEATDVPVGTGIIVGNIIIAQPTAGEYRAYSTACPHQNGIINKISGLEATCPNHNSTFSLEDGKVLKGPARDPMKPREVTMDGSTLVIK